jgi:hypothetical protein
MAARVLKLRLDTGDGLQIRGNHLESQRPLRAARKVTTLILATPCRKH